MIPVFTTLQWNSNPGSTSVPVMLSTLYHIKNYLCYNVQVLLSVYNQLHSTVIQPNTLSLATSSFQCCRHPIHIRSLLHTQHKMSDAAFANMSGMASVMASINILF